MVGGWGRFALMGRMGLGQVSALTGILFSREFRGERLGRVIK
jgi:hypothetical protein